MEGFKMMSYEDIKQIFSDFRRERFKPIGGFLILVILAFWMNGYFGKKGEQTAIKQEKTDYEKSQNNHTSQGHGNVSITTTGNNNSVTMIGKQKNYFTADGSSLIPTLETIRQLGYLSIWTNDGGSRQSYETLLSWEKDEGIEPNLKRQISSEIKRIQEKYYIVPMRRVIDNEDGGILTWRWICKCKSNPEARDCSNGIEPPKGFAAANVIAHFYKTAPETPWQERARAACILRNIRTAYNKDGINKREFFERLVVLMSENERSLCVSKMAFETYKDLTSFRPKSNDVFAFEEAIEDWKQRKEEVLKIDF